MSALVVKNGIRNKLQRYLCKECKHKFYDNGNSFVRMRTPNHIVVTSLNLYFSGLSSRKAIEQIEAIYGQKISQVSIWNWIQKYSKLVSNYVETLKPKLSGKYHHDETEIKVDGDGRYLWETLDEDTRFIVAHLLTDIRSTENAKKVFQKALSKQRPSVLFTDGSYSYVNAFRKVYGTRYKEDRVQWVQRVGIRARETNNIVERLHSTFKTRYRVLRGLKTDKTAKTFLDGYVAYYNFCRNHQSLETTPAKAAGLEVKGWKQLIENAQIQKTRNETKILDVIEVKVK
jgi:transposase-like protein